MGKEEVISGLIMELRRGTIVLSVLSQLNTPMYGYHLVRTLSEHGLNVEANTLYPLLRRLENQGLLESTWETGGSKPRKYYSTTEMGKEVYGELKEHWNASVKSVRGLLEEKDEK
ncbi:MAG: PadR family transcriptional regulator [Eubacteriaceae bacterium]